MELSELTTGAALLFDNKEYKKAVQDIQSLKAFTDEVIKKIRNSKNVVFGSESSKSESLNRLEIKIKKADDIFSAENMKILKNIVVGISAAKEIKIFMASHRVKITQNVKVYMTGGSWPKEIIKFKVNAAGMADYNSSDIMVSEDQKTYFGISLKKKTRVAEDDPTLINKAFNTILESDEFKKLREELDLAKINYFTDLVIEAVNKGYINFTDINDTTGKKLKTKNEWTKFSKSQAGRNELYLSKKKDKNLFERRYINTKGSAFHREGYKTDQTTGDASMRQWVNKKLSGKDSTLWQNFVGIMNQYSELFADRLIDIILKTNLFEYMDAETLKHYDFDFALVTGVANVTKKAVVLNKGSVIPLGTTLCGLKRIEKKYKTAQFKIKVDEVKQSTSEMAGVSMSLNKGGLTILNLTLRYKGDFSVQPSFLATIDDQFKSLMKKECTGFR